jgi:nucleoside phosphorylase
MALKVLLLEDDPSKKARLLAMLHEKYETFGEVHTAICTSEARRLLTESEYDLFIADVVVPADLGSSPAEENCISLFEEIDEGVGNIITPRYALPISSHSDISSEAHDFFRSRPWGILPYDEASKDCLSAIEKIAEFIHREIKKSSAIPACDIFIVTALMEPEFSALERLDLGWGPLEPLDSSQLVRFGEIRVRDNSLRVAAGFSARMGPVAASILTTKASMLLQPKLVLMGGICAGIPGKAEIGDLIAAELAWDWQSGKYIDKAGNEAFEIAPHQFCIDDKSRNQLLLLKRDTDFWASLQANADKHNLKKPALRLGPMASGASVVSDERVTNRIKENQHKNVVGLDMETYAVYASSTAVNPRASFISMKAVSDMGDIKKSDDYQEYAADISAAAIFRFLTRFCEPAIEG